MTEQDPLKKLADKVPLRQSLLDFNNFIRKQGVVGLATGFILGGAISKVVSSIANDLIQPLIGYVFGSEQGLMSLHLGSVMYGRFLSNVVDFLIIAWVVFFLFKQLKLEKLDLPKQ